MSDSENTARNTKEVHFSMDDYPKSYASTKLEDYRLRNYLDLDDDTLEVLTNELFDLCIKHEDEATPRTEYKGYEHIASGWEWSVFKKPGEKLVVKVPAGLFLEVNDHVYLTNSEDTYRKIEASYPPKMIAKARFYREEVQILLSKSL
jgi:hypothetical protein